MRSLAAVLGLGLLLTACGSPAGDDGDGGTALPAEPGALVLRVAYTGGYVTPETTVSRLPLVSVYSDGRVVTEGPVPAIYPGPAWPNVQVADLPDGGVQELVDAALAAGVAETGDLGEPPLADAATTRFTLVTDGETHVRDVYALDFTDGGYTAEQQSARDALTDLVERLTVLDGGTAAYEPTAVAAIASPYTPGDATLPDRSPVEWPGPDLPGETVGPGVACVLATGEQTAAVTTAARDADGLTPWTSGGQQWAVTFRPLLPDEQDCTDLGG